MFNPKEESAIIYRVVLHDGWRTTFGPFWSPEAADVVARAHGGTIEYALIEWKAVS